MILSLSVAALLLQAAAPTTDAPSSEGGVQSTPAVPGGYRVGSGPTAEAAQTGYVILPPVALARTGVTIDAYDKRVESRWGADDPFYAGVVRGGAALAQSRQGQLDGGWTLAKPDGSVLYVLQLVDAGEGWLEGAWRRDGVETGASPAASGFIALISRAEGRVVLRFLEPGAAAPTAVTLEMSADGSWTGQAAQGEAPVTPVRMLRR